MTLQWNNLELKIPSEALNLNQVEEFLQDVFLHYDIDQTTFGPVLLCLNEAVKNAIEHGNKFDKEKMVHIWSSRKGNCLYFVVADQGEGFDYKIIPDPTSLENLKNESGRGIHIIKNICEKVEFRKRGNIIKLTFRLSGKDSLLF